MMPRYRSIGLLALSLAGPAMADDMIKVGVLQPLAGECATWGVPITRGAEIWADEINQTGGIKDASGTAHQIEINGYDNACYTAGEELTAARRAILDDGVQFLMQTYTPASRQAIAPLVTANKVLTLSYGAGFLSKDFPYLIGSVTGAPTAFMLLAGNIIETHPDIRNIAIVTPDHSYGQSAKAFFRAGVAPYADRVKIVYDESYDPAKADDMFGLATPIADAKPDLVLELGMPPGQQALFVEAMQQLGYGGLFASGGWTMSFLKDRVPTDYLDGRLFSAYVVDAAEPSFSPRMAVFYKTYVDTYGAAEWSSWASVGYAAMTTLEPGIKAAPTATGEAVRAALFASDTVEQPLFGRSVWGGAEIYGANTHLLTPLPVYATDGAGNVSLRGVVNAEAWWQAHKDAALPELKAGGQVVGN